MQVRIKFFSLLREAAGANELTLDFAGHTAGDLWVELERKFPALAPFRAARAIAINREHAQEQHPVRAGDEVAFFPPVSGG